MPTKQYLVFDEPHRKTRSFYVGASKIEAPCYMPEVKSEEDLEALLRFPKALDVHTPILVPPSKWPSMIANPRYQYDDPLNHRINILQYLKEHPVIFFEPPELFRYAYPRDIVSYALHGNIQRIKQFYAALRSKEADKALTLVSEFYRPFISRQMRSICKSRDIELNEETGDKYEVEKAWLDEKLVEGAYFNHMAEIVKDAINMPCASVVPTVPALTKATVESDVYIHRVLSTNSVTQLACKMLTGSRKTPIGSYFHLYIDGGVLEYDDGHMALAILEEGLLRGDYCGVVVTVTGYNEPGKLPRIERFINDVVNIAHSRTVSLPVILTRSGWYGLYLTDYGIQAFSSLLNGKAKYSNGRGLKNPDDQYGVLPIIDSCTELKLADAKAYLAKYGELPEVANLPTRVDSTIFDDPWVYRVCFSKPMRLIHAEEARRIRRAQAKDIRNPARRYFERSDHPLLKNA